MAEESSSEQSLITILVVPIMHRVSSFHLEESVRVTQSIFSFRLLTVEEAGNDGVLFALSLGDDLMTDVRLSNALIRYTVRVVSTTT
ncbi:hypothetical protein M404DRAFT_1007490 [Pisolithus tinctorius Marx 270]|uniref:Uncharacterized protein n=1 Tax=Pisolithus tinctorius Marx 270 TaxID=870435 RepID=A0A0C3NJ08_PISTI|nr:hypothetical protein M404DRAFT_1007490 [Pisolithus tinctorius Marx 270]